MIGEPVAADAAGDAEAPEERPQELPSEAGRQLMEMLGPAFMVFRDKVLSMTFDTVLGPMRFAENGLPIAKFPVAQWQGGKAELVYPDRAKTKDALHGGRDLRLLRGALFVPVG